jgi:hypothetical protein
MPANVWIGVVFGVLKANVFTRETFYNLSGMWKQVPLWEHSTHGPVLPTSSSWSIVSIHPDRWYKQTFPQNHENNNRSPVYIDKMNNFDRADFNFLLIFSQKWQIKVIKICMDIYGELKISSVLNIIQRLQILDILEICYLYNLLWKYVKKYINPGIDFFVCIICPLKKKYHSNCW